MNVRPAVYRAFDADGDLLYIGSSRNAVFRVGEHERYRRSNWFSLVARIDITHFDTLDAARTAEAEAIAVEHPRFNYRGNPLRDRSTEAPRPPRPPYRVALGRRIEQARLAAGLTRVEVAAVCGVTKAAISHWENGRSVPALNRQGPLADALGVSLDDLFGLPGLTREAVAS